MDEKKLRVERSRQRRDRTVVQILDASDCGDPEPVRGAEAVALVTRLSAIAWSLGGHPLPTYARHEVPVRIVRRAP